jgi:hypothetical protein
VAPEDVYRLFWYVQHCRPFFILCLGDLMGQMVKADQLDFNRFNLREFPWLQHLPERGSGGEATITELLLAACHKIPLLIDPRLAAASCLFYFPSLMTRSKRHPLIEQKGVMESLSMLNHSRSVMRELKKDVLNCGARVTEYENPTDLSVHVMRSLADSINEAYPPDDAPRLPEYVAMMMDQQLERCSKGVVGGLEEARYVRNARPNGATTFTPAATSQHKGQLLPELLDRYLEDERMRTPLIVVDRPGGGVSAMLAGWMRSCLSRADEVVAASIPQYGECLSQATYVSRGCQRLMLYLDLELLSHRLDVTSTVHVIMAAMKAGCPSLSHELPDPSLDVLPAFHQWLSSLEGEQLVLILDGLDYVRVKGDDPVEWLPAALSPWVRIVGTTFPIGRVVYACDAAQRMWTTVRRRSELSVEDKAAVVDGVLRAARVGWLREWVAPLIKSDKTSYMSALRSFLQVCMRALLQRVA